MNRTYTVRPLGMVAWAEGIPTLGEARELLRECRDRGLKKVCIFDDLTDEIVIDRFYDGSGDREAGPVSPEQYRELRRRGHRDPWGE